jgi:S-adenosylmethionine:tRNA ribosyltransferase-isomerase
MMNIDEFHYSLPQELIAQQPLRRRDQARLMVIDRRRRSIQHDIFRNIGHYLPQQSCLVLNDSRVIPARLLGRRSPHGGAVEIFLLKRLADGYCYETLLRPLRRLKVNERIIFNGGKLVAHIKDRDNRIVRFNRKNMTGQLNQIGHIPLPPYIKRKDTAADRKYYQTVYAKADGSVASPSAGLHFTERLLKRLERAGHTILKVTLHINYATFKPVEEKDITRHHMHTEEYALSSKTFEALKKAKDQGRKVVAVGTSSCRVLETMAQRQAGDQQAGSLQGNTDLFIYPGYHFRMTDILVTNFHLPLSTLLMLVYAFGTTDIVEKAYQHAIKQKYRFYSYGDAMIIF